MRQKRFTQFKRSLPENSNRHWL